MMRLLFIAHYFPPLGGAGVQRAVKLVKYLPEFGIVPSVLTGPGQPSDWWSPPDPSLLREVPAGVAVYRTGSNRPGGAHRRSLIELGRRAAREGGADAILVSMSPFSDAAVAAELSRSLGIPWIADLRDPWALDEFQVYRSVAHRIWRTVQMRAALQSASLIVANTPEAAARLRQQAGLRSKRIIANTNGYDAHDFPADADPPANSRFTIVHSGYWHTAAGLHQQEHRLQYRLLGRTRRGVGLLGRSPFYLLQALERWSESDPSIVDRLMVRFVGQASRADMDLVRASSAAAMIEFTGYMSHNESVAQVRCADLLFLPMHCLPPGSRATIVPGKAYEYMASGRPILAAVPDGDAKDYLMQAGTAALCGPCDVDEMVRLLRRQYAMWESGRVERPTSLKHVRQFERRELARHLAEEVYEVLGRSDPARLVAKGQP